MLPSIVKSISCYSHDYCLFNDSFKQNNIIIRKLCNDNQLKEIEFPLNQTKIYDDMIYRCKQLTKVQLNNNIKEIGEKSFFECI